jgi:N6-adenosine-specific RNA methylase IME4
MTPGLDYITSPASVACKLYEFHPLSSLFPLMEGEDFTALVADIRKQGLLEPVVLFDSKILDGRNRYRACLDAGVEPTFSTYEGNDPLGYVISLNLQRRHLDESQRAMVAAKLATLKRGDNQHSPIGETSQAKAADLLNVGKRSVERAAAVRDHGSPELVHAVEQGRVAVSVAADIATQPIDQQREIVARGEGEILRAAAEIRARRAEAKRAERVRMLIAASNASAPLPADRRFPVILADPPYRYERQWSVSRDIENHYPTMSTEDICALPIGQLATPDAMLFLWTPAPLLTDALEIMRTWGFQYVTSAVWVKDKIGMGVYLRQQHELLLICKRGNSIVPVPGLLSPSVIEAARSRHSEKPVEAYELIERMYPELPKIELFARNARDGWAVWGNQAPRAVAEGADIRRPALAPPGDSFDDF